jgi:hypothetical protein
MFYTEKDIQDIHKSATGMLALGNTRIGWLCSDWLTLMEQRDEKARWVTELQEKLVQADMHGIETCASCEASLDVVSLTDANARLEKERDEARKALCRVYQVMELPDGKHIADGDWALIDALIESGLYDAALARGQADHA